MFYVKTFLGLIKKNKNKNNKTIKTKKQTSPPQKKGKENLKTQQFNG